ncbi:MAG: hypothetical protein R2788_22140 [Saprospiraceae bacterium]
MKINRRIDRGKKGKDTAKLSKKLQQLNRLVEGHIANEEDRQIFEAKHLTNYDQFLNGSRKNSRATPVIFRARQPI